jgi:surfactin synthase thioesterase subunit
VLIHAPVHVIGHAPGGRLGYEAMTVNNSIHVPSQKLSVERVPAPAACTVKKLLIELKALSSLLFKIN